LRDFFPPRNFGLQHGDFRKISRVLHDRLAHWRRPRALPNINFRRQRFAGRGEIRHDERERQYKKDGNGHAGDINGFGFIRQTKTALSACFSAVSE